MTNINLTDKETDLMITFGNLADEDTADEQIAAGPVFASADELARYAEMEPKSVKSVANSLIKKGMIIKDEDGQYELTEAAVRWAYDNRPKSEIDQVNEEVNTLSEDEVVANIKGQLQTALAQDGATKCSALRAVAKECVTGRALFIKAAAAVGINSGTAARQWQEGRADEAPKAASEDVKEKAVAYLMTLAPDEVVEILMEKLTAKAVKEIAALSE